MNSNPFDQLADHLVLRGTAEAFAMADASEGRGIAGLAPVLNRANAGEIVAAASHLTRAKIQLLLANRFPRPDVPSEVRAIESQVSDQPLSPSSATLPESPSAPGRMNMTSPEQFAASALPALPAAVATPSHPVAPASFVPRPKVEPIAPRRFAVQLTIDQETHDKLRYAQALLGHAVPSGDLSQVLVRALDALIHVLERSKFAAASHSRPAGPRGKRNERHVPANVRQAVWQRDGGQCTFVGENGKRCEARARLEFDHIEAVARGGQATAANLRLRCRTHNQYTAERAFGIGFMEHKRQKAKRARARSRDASQGGKAARPAGHGVVREHVGTSV